MVTDKERLVSLEVKVDAAQEGLRDHEDRIDTLEKAFVSLIHEVKLIRYALFALAGGSAPGVVKQIITLFSGIE